MTTTNQIIGWTIFGLLLLFLFAPLILYQCVKFCVYGYRKANQLFDKSEKGDD